MPENKYLGSDSLTPHQHISLVHSLVFTQWFQCLLCREVCDCKNLRAMTKILINCLLHPRGVCFFLCCFCLFICCPCYLSRKYMAAISWTNKTLLLHLRIWLVAFDFSKNYISNSSALLSISFSVPIYRYIKLLWTLPFTKYFFLCSEMLFFLKWIYLFVCVYASQPLTWDEGKVRHWAPCSVFLVLPCLSFSMDNFLSNEESPGPTDAVLWFMQRCMCRLFSELITTVAWKLPLLENHFRACSQLNT